VQLAVHVAKIEEVYAICGRNNVSYAESLGASKVFDYTNTNDYVENLKGTFDLVLDCVGGDEYYHNLFPLLRPETGVYVTCVGPVLHGGSEPITPWTLLQTTCTLVPRLLGNYLPGRWNSRYKMYLSFTTSEGVLDGVAKALEDGLIDPRIDPISPVPLEKLGDAHLKVETGHSEGKVVVNIVSETKYKFFLLN
jgi:NADPH:quinone reductase-like Zn-dependent oxidoreductase